MSKLNIMSIEGIKFVSLLSLDKWLEEREYVPAGELRHMIGVEALCSEDDE